MSEFVPEGWAIKPLSVMSSKISDGIHSTPKYTNYSQYPFINGNNLKSGKIVVGDNAKYVCETEYLKHKKSLDFQTILMSINGTIGNLAYYQGEEVVLGKSASYISLSNDVSKEFIYYSLSSDNTKKYYDLELTGSTISNLSLRAIKDTPILTPPLPEQQKIAAILTSVDEVIENTQAQINKLKDLKTGMMQELLTRGVGVDGKPHTEFKESPVGRIPMAWDVDTFDNVFTLKNGVNKGKEFFGQGVPIISYRNVYDGNGIYDGMLTNRVEMTESELSRFKVNLGDIFITRTSETADEIGFTNVYLGSLDNVVYNGFVIRARQKRKIFDINYCKYAFQANYMRQQMIHSSKFTTRAGISGESLNLLKIIIPPLSEQKAIGDALSAVDGRIQTLMKIKTSKVSLKKALMQDLLTGKVRVKVDTE